MAVEHTTPLRILLVREHGYWVAQALEYDFAAQGATRADALNALAHTIGSHVYVAQRRGVEDPLAKVPSAPNEYWALFEQAARTRIQAVDLDAPGLPPLFGIEAESDQAPAH